MVTKAGVWIDHKQAVIVLVTGAEKEIKKIAFDIGQPIRAAGGSRSKNPYKPKEFVAEDTQRRSRTIAGVTSGVTGQPDPLAIPAASMAWMLR